MTRVFPESSKGIQRASRSRLRFDNHGVASADTNPLNLRCPRHGALPETLNFDVIDVILLRHLDLYMTSEQSEGIVPESAN